MVSVSGRELILEILLQITRDGEYSHIALKNVLDQYQYLDKKERAFITRVVDGTLERMIELDYIIDQFSKVKVRKMKPVIRTIIRSAVYQLKYMDSVPDSAACNEAVKLAVKMGAGGKAFGSISTKEIAEAIEKELGLEVDKKKISTDGAIKDGGEYTVNVKLHPEVSAKVKVLVAAL